MNQLISMIVLSYKNTGGIYETLDSIFMQSYDNIEIVISDDATPGFSDEIPSIKKYIENNAKENIKNVIFNAIEINGGTVKNINSALRMATGEYLKVLSAEDRLSDCETLKDYVEFLENSQYEICFGKMRGVKPDGEFVYELLACESNYNKLKAYTQKQTLNRLFARNFLPAPAWCIKKSLFEKYGLIPEDTRLIEDYHYWIYLTMQGVEFGYLDKTTIDYKLSGVSSGGSYSLMFMNDMLAIYDKYIFPNDKRFGILQPFYNLLKRSGLNFYITKAKWPNLSKSKKFFSVIKYFPFYIYTSLLDSKVKKRNKKINSQKGA